ncbi:energy-coupling factor ABC transporter substrate-binding protein [Acerihabitans sp. TG2]|uniref:energy-coupling factor ABC transporter substrate-binding protein n=1 Tax=Acerihabitans sp. TG2 TaxID=3096008 RepID=UPI002B2373C4|nr:energy-coupling factor ABC transporter substrate-binding protein [Acerihabitans sp. TG2]MEA9389331.1 energy-coupling factor ABC transporter substrate-binding protein [Acerihabitans sp. TG2]
MKKMLILLSLVVMLMVMPFFINHGGSYDGSDNQAESLVTRIAPHYKPWFTPLYEPASSEIESLLFTLQGSLGTAVIFYILGYYKGRDRRRTLLIKKPAGNKRIRYGRHAGN